MTMAKIEPAKNANLDEKKPSETSTEKARHHSPTKQDEINIVEVSAQITLPPDGGWGWVVVLSSFLIFSLNDGAMYTFGSSIFRPISTGLNLSPASVSLINSITVSSSFIFGPVVSAIINRYGFRICTMVGSAITCISFFFTFLFGNYPSLLIFYGLAAGLGFGMMNMAAMIVLGFYFQKLRAIAFAIAITGRSFGVIVFSPLYAHLNQVVGWRYTVLLQASLTGLCYFLAMAFRPLLSLTVVKATMDTEKDILKFSSPALSTINVGSRNISRIRRWSEDEEQVPRKTTFKSNFNYPTAAEVINDISAEDIRAASKITPGPSRRASQFAVIPVNKNAEYHQHDLERVKSLLFQTLGEGKKENEQAKPKSGLLAASTEEPQSRDGEERQSSTRLETMKSKRLSMLVDGKKSRTGSLLIDSKKLGRESITFDGGKKSRRASIVKDILHWEEHVAEARPMYRDDAFLEATHAIPTNHEDAEENALDYQLKVSRVADTEDLKQRKGGIFTLGKVLNFFPVGGERECQTSRGNTVAKSGICLNPYDCRQRDGKPAGDCAHGLGVCCVFEVTCGGVVQHNISYFMSPGFPELWPADQDCNITIEKAYAGITQLRVDFVHFNIGQPNRSSGDCDQDVMILGGDPKPFRLCGQNHGQHIYHTLSTAVESRDEDLASSESTVLSIRPRGGFNPRLWMLKLSQMPLAYSAPHDCLQYFTGDQGTITTFNYAVNGRYLAGQEYRVCVKKNPGFCAIRYQPCDDRSFRIGPGLPQNLQNLYMGIGPGSNGGPGTGFYGPDASFVQEPVMAQNDPTLTQMDQGSDEVVDQGVVDTQNDPVEEDIMPVASEPVEDMIEGSGDEVEPESQLEQPSMTTRIWRLIWPSWLWGQRSRARTWGRWSPYSQHYSNRVEDDFVYQGYGKFGDGLNGFGRMRCQDRITIPCENEYFLTEIAGEGGPGVCDPHHCGPSFCPGIPSSSCQVHSSISPFQVSMHFGEPQSKGNPEENIGACLMYSQVPCGS